MHFTSQALILMLSEQSHKKKKKIRCISKASYFFVDTTVDRRMNEEYYSSLSFMLDMSLYITIVPSLL